MFAAAKNGNGFSKSSDKLDCFEKVWIFDKRLQKNLKKVLLETKKGFIFAPALRGKLWGVSKKSNRIYSSLTYWLAAIILETI